MRIHLPWVPDMWEVCGGCISYSHLLRTLVRIMPGSEVEVIFHLLPGRSLWLVSVTTTCSEETDVCARSHSLEEIGPSPWGFPFTSLWLVMVWTCLTLDPRGPVWELLVVCKVFPFFMALLVLCDISDGFSNLQDQPGNCLTFPWNVQ